MTPNATSSEADVLSVNIDQLIGAAIFDLSGLPKEYFTTTKNQNVSWVQTIFQALGLQSLLVSSLQLEGFKHAIINGADYKAIVVRQKSKYSALLFPQLETTPPLADMLEWAQTFEPEQLKQHPQFSNV